MAFPAEPPAPPPPPARVRPVQVAVAVWALYVLAATQLLSAIVPIFTLGPTVDATRDYVEGTRDGDAIVASVQIFSFVAIALGLIFAVVFAVLAVFVNRGNQPARIVSWVVLGITLCCNGFSLLGAAAGGALSGGSTGEIDQEELTRRVEDAVPGWVTPVNYLLLFIGILATLAGIILLALPAANEFFRKQQAVWEPPVPGAYYPAPGAPGAPGAPAQPGQPSQPAPVGDPVLPLNVPPAAEAAPAEAKPSVDVTKPAADDAPAAETAPSGTEAAPSATEAAPSGTDAAGQPSASDESVKDSAESGEQAPSDERNDKPGSSPGQPGTGHPPPAL